MCDAESEVLLCDPIMSWVYNDVHLSVNSRKHDNEDESDVPATKRPEEVCHLIANTSLNDLATESTGIKTNTVATTKKVIKIRRKCANHKSEPVTTSVSSEKVQKILQSSVHIYTLYHTVW